MAVLFDNYLMMKKRTGALIIFFNQKAEVLVQIRGDYSKFWETHAFFGGWVEEWETHLEGFLREAREELGLDMTQFPYEYIWEQIEYHPEKDTEITRHFYIIPTDRTESDFTVYEGSGCQYYSLEDIKTLHFPNPNASMVDFISPFILKKLS